MRSKIKESNTEKYGREHEPQNVYSESTQSQMSYDLIHHADVASIATEPSRPTYCNQHNVKDNETA
jgi:hypothetical protein